MNITFDMTALNNSKLSNSNVFITFAANTSDMVYDPNGKKELINFSGGNIKINGTSYGTSSAYSLEEIAKNGLVLNSAISLVGFISYGSKTGIELLPIGSQPNFLNAITPRYSIFEISYNGTTGGADITNISQYGGSISMEFLNNKVVQSKVGNTIDTTSMFTALANASGFSGTTSTPVIYLDSNGDFLRAIGTNVFPNGTIQTPYPTFNAYLQSLFTTYGTKSVVLELTNLATGASPGGTGSVGYDSTKTATKVTAGSIYNLDYHFKAVVSQVTLPDPTNNNPNGTYSVGLSGYVNATLAGVADAKTIKNHKYDNLSITIPADDLTAGAENLYMTNFIYMASTTGAGINVTSSGWNESDLNNDFGVGVVNAAFLQKVAGDFAEGIICGFPGSITNSNTTPVTELSDLSSYDWWQNPQLAYAKAQPKNAFYSIWGNVIYANSGGVNGITFSVGGVYGSPYDDRFGLNLISPDANTTDMLITLLADGDLTPTTT